MTPKTATKKLMTTSPTFITNTTFTTVTATTSTLSQCKSDTDISLKGLKCTEVYTKAGLKCGLHLARQ